jgi:non-canonical purine NTP pyrophosphatase (RdgB/HAM1 family)
MSLYFITGNKNKFFEVQQILPQIEQSNIDLSEIQHMDAHEVIRHKLLSAFQHARGEFIVEDTSLYIDGLRGLPGPLGKWFEKTVGYVEVYRWANSLGNTKAKALVLIGYAKSQDATHFFEGVLHGRVVSPRGTSGFGWDSIFQPDGSEKTLGEMGLEEKNTMSMRRQAVEALREFLQKSTVP